LAKKLALYRDLKGIWFLMARHFLKSWVPIMTFGRIEGMKYSLSVSMVGSLMKQVSGNYQPAEPRRPQNRVKKLKSGLIL